ncbi:hypothetical protein C8F04DRAFT_1264253 [Mycena alexandri]|uniref:Bacteriophage T5 Orf172 DNA-binding domain-containing protein n=1 Tax=Mycena alexandri TaxID=1745969 RepID=A0AAD6SM83_9AGAR|nr:hypothetical protein C8F04DRAFT_1264253 [Mycena alexandri]
MARTSARRAAAALVSCRLCRVAQQQISLHVANGDRARALRVITRCAKPQHQAALHLRNRGLYARDGAPGHMYCCASVPTSVYNDVVAGTISQSDFERALRVKVGVAENVFVRRDDYAICDSNGQTHFWLFYVPTRQRYRIERLMHLDFLSRARRNIRKCSGCRKHHREYWRFIFVGPFQRIRARVFALLARIGEPGARLIPLNDYHRVF